VDSFAHFDNIEYRDVRLSIKRLSDIKFSTKDLEINILHNVYGEDIPIAIDPIFIANSFNIDVIEVESMGNKESLIYFSKITNKITIKFKKTSKFKKAFIISYNLGHLFLHILQNKKIKFYKEISSKNNYQEHRVANNQNYKTQDINYIYEQEATIFAGKLLIPEGALKDIFKDIKKGYRFLLSDLCKVFDSPNDIMVTMLKTYNMWDMTKIYDNL
jgi:Zn-dependent peptidase ImmA (M78 family)